MINSYTYEQYNAIWCKVVSFKEMDENPQNDKEIIEECIEEIYLYFTPERWGDSYQLKESEWHISQGEHIQVVEEIIKGAIFYQEKEKEEDIERRDEILNLSYIDIEGGIEAYQNASKEVQEHIRKQIKQYYSPINEVDLLPPQNFTSYAELKEAFLEKTFIKNIHFYFNKTAKETQKSIQEKDRDNVPAVIGMDNEKVAMMWFNF